MCMLHSMLLSVCASHVYCSTIHCSTIQFIYVVMSGVIKGFGMQAIDRGVRGRGR